MTFTITEPCLHYIYTGLPAVRRNAESIQPASNLDATTLLVQSIRYFLEQKINLLAGRRVRNHPPHPCPRKKSGRAIRVSILAVDPHAKSFKNLPSGDNTKPWCGI